MVKGLHTWEVHDFWVGRNNMCPYCHSGSKPVDKVVILEELSK